MWINYRSPKDAVVGKNRYGYFATLRSAHAKTGEEMVITTHEPANGYWPLTLAATVRIHNHEDLQLFVDQLVCAYDATRGEHGEGERISPSESKLF